MGEAKNKRRSHAELLKQSPFCVFCGGNTPAVTVDHIPAAIMFDGKQRPKGLEFPACEICNNGAKHADLVAAWIGRMLPDAEQETGQKDIKKLLQAISNNIPGLLEEMKMGRAGQKLAKRRLSSEFDGGFLRIGPLAQKYMQVFCLKLGLALYYEVSENILPEHGNIAIRWFSNYEKLIGEFPEELANFLGPSKTLKAGQKHVSDQFQYAWQITENKELGIYFASFRMSFAVFAVIATNPKTVTLPSNQNGMKWYSPLDLKKLIQVL